MDRRTFLTAGAATAASVATAASAAALGAGLPAVAADRGKLLWAADFSNATNSDEAAFGDVQTQVGGEGILDNQAPIPVVTHPVLGRALKLHLAENGERLEAEPGGGQNLKEGDELYFRLNFALGDDFPIHQTNPFCLINQIHQGSNVGSPPIEFDVHNGALWIRGNSDAYNHELMRINVGHGHRLVYRVKFSATPKKSIIEVWIDGKKVLGHFRPPCALINDGVSYWKGATMYCDPSIPPLTVYQNNHRLGTTYASVN
jgi:hypothetical protein